MLYQSKLGLKMVIKTILLLTLFSFTKIYAGDFSDLSTREDGYIAFSGGQQKLALKFNEKFGYSEFRPTSDILPTTKGNKDKSFSGTGFSIHGGQFIKPDTRVGVQYLSAGNSEFKTTMLGAYADYLFDTDLYIGIGLNTVSLDYSDESDIKTAKGFIPTYRAGMVFKIGLDWGLDINYQFTNALLSAKHKGYKDTDLSDGDASIASDTELGEYQSWGFLNVGLSYHF